VSRGTALAPACRPQRASDQARGRRPLPRKAAAFRPIGFRAHRSVKQGSGGGGSRVNVAIALTCGCRAFCCARRPSLCGRATVRLSRPRCRSCLELVARLTAAIVRARSRCRRCERPARRAVVISSRGPARCHAPAFRAPAPSQPRAARGGTDRPARACAKTTGADAVTLSSTALCFAGCGARPERPHRFALTLRHSGAALLEPDGSPWVHPVL
jgi:hypothetical protein